LFIFIYTYRCFCARIGGSNRQEYAMVGPSVNLSARIMGVAKTLSVSILSDQRTYFHAKQRIHFKTTIQPVFVKGKQDLVPVFEPLNLLDVSSTSLKSSDSFIGRKTEFDQITNLIKQLSENPSSLTVRTIIIQGDAGVGNKKIKLIFFFFLFKTNTNPN